MKVAAKRALSRHFGEALHPIEMYPSLSAVAEHLYYRRLHPRRVVQRASLDEDKIWHNGGIGREQGTAVRAESTIDALPTIALIMVDLSVPF